LFDFKKIEQKKIPWALGSDIGGGPFLSMLDVMQSFVRQNKKAKRKNATYIKALYRATLAGAEILAVQKKTGNLSKGKEANFIVLPLKGDRYKDAESCLSQILNSEKNRSRFDSYVEKTFYRGSQVFKRS
jgi:guanine deaminase